MIWQHACALGGIIRRAKERSCAVRAARAVTSADVSRGELSIAYSAVLRYRAGRPSCISLLVKVAVMTEAFNSAQRVHDILFKARGMQANARASDMWAEALDIQDGDNIERHYRVVALLSTLRDEVRLAQAAAAHTSVRPVKYQAAFEAVHTHSILTTSQVHSMLFTVIFGLMSYPH